MSRGWAAGGAQGAGWASAHRVPRERVLSRVLIRPKPPGSQTLAGARVPACASRRKITERGCSPHALSALRDGASLEVVLGAPRLPQEAALISKGLLPAGATGLQAGLPP